MTPAAFHELFHLDIATGRLIWRAPPKQHAERVGREAGYLNRGKGRNKDYWQVRAFGKTLKRSRVVFFMTSGRWPEPGVDHINGDSLDDRPANLRECDQSQNTANSRDKIRRVDLPRGVYRTKQGRFMARLTVHGSSKSLGTFDTPAEALSIYTAARKEAFHEFA